VAPRAYNSVRRELASIQTRDAILSAAVELFGSGGYARTTIAEIARRAGVATNTVYTSVEPGLVRVDDWRPEPGAGGTRQSAMWAAVGRRR